MDAISIPYGVSLEGLIDVIAAWHRAKGCINPLKNHEVAERVKGNAKLDSKAKIVSNQSSFLTQIGLLEKIGQQNKLTELGCRIARMADYALNSEFNENMRTVLLNWSEGIPLIDFLFYKVSVKREDLVKRIVVDAGKSMDTTNASMGGEALIDLMERIAVIAIDDQNAISLRDEVRGLVTSGELSLEPTKRVTASKEVSISSTSLRIEVQITLKGHLESQDLQVLVDRLKEILENLQYRLIDDDRNQNH